jgi:hypothetical protein
LYRLQWIYTAYMNRRKPQPSSRHTTALSFLCPVQEAKAQVAGGLTVGGLQVAHIAHLGGAFAGVLLVWLLTQIPDPDAAKQ